MARTVGEVMTREVVEARPETPFKDVARLLDRHRISGLPVVDHDDKVLGVISETDLLRIQAGRSGRGRVRRLRGPALRRLACAPEDVREESFQQQFERVDLPLSQGLHARSEELLLLGRRFGLALHDHGGQQEASVMLNVRRQP